MNIQFSLTGEVRVNVSTSGAVTPDIEVPLEWHQAIMQAVPSGTTLQFNDLSRTWSFTVTMTDTERAKPLDKYTIVCEKKLRQKLAALNVAIRDIKDNTLPTVPKSWTSPLAVSARASTFGAKD